jgi:Tol biopolymer transport system component
VSASCSSDLPEQTTVQPTLTPQLQPTPLPKNGSNGSQVSEDKFSTPVPVPVPTSTVSPALVPTPTYKPISSTALAPTPVQLHNQFSSDVIFELRESVVRITSSSGQGTGILIGDDGLIITTYGLILEDPTVIVELSDGSKQIGIVLGRDQIGDLAAIDIYGDNFKEILVADTSLVLPGDDVIALGYPLQGSVRQHTGQIISPNEHIFSIGDLKEVPFVTSNIPTWDGGLGSPLINSNNELVGFMVGNGLAISADRLSLVKSTIINGESIILDIENDIIYTFRPNPNADTILGLTDAYGSGEKLLPRQHYPSAWGEISPDGNKLLFASARGPGSNWDIYVSDADGTDEIRLTHDKKNDLSPAWSGDGNKITFVSDRDGNYEIYIMNANGTEEIRLTNNTAKEGYPHFNPQNDRIVFSSNKDGDYEIYSIDSNGKNEIRWTDNDFDDDAPRWSRDGKAFVFHSDRSGDYDIYRMIINGKEEQKISDSTMDERFADWSENGKAIVFSIKVAANNEELFIYESDGTIRQITEGGGKKIFARWVTSQQENNHSKFMNGHFSVRDISSTFWGKYGAKVFASDLTGNHEIYIMNFDGSVKDQLTDSISSERQPSLSPDGKSIVFMSNNTGFWEIYKISIGNLVPIKLTNNESYYHVNGHPQWSPDGSKIAYWSFVDREADIFIMDSDGSNKRNITASLGADLNPSWSPDGSTIIFQSDRDGSSDIHTINVEDMSRIVVTNDSGFEGSADWSPDGRYILYHSDKPEVGRNGNFDIYIADVDGANIDRKTKATAKDLDPSWSNNGNRISYVSYVEGNADIYEIDVDSEDVAFLTSGSQSDISPDSSYKYEEMSGKVITYHSIYNDAMGATNVYRMNKDGTGNIQLTNSLGNDASPQWSTQTGKILFDSNRDEDLEVYVMNADGSDQLNLSNDSSRDDTFPSWSHDGKSVVFQSKLLGSDGYDQVFIMGVDGQNKVQLTNANGKSIIPRISPEGDKILFLSDRDGIMDVYTMDLDGGNQTNITNSAHEELSANWSPNGKQIVFSKNINSQSQIFVMDSDGRNGHNVSNNTAMETYPDFSASGTVIVFMSDLDGMSQIYSMNIYGTERVKLTDVYYAGQPNWPYSID